MKLSLCMPALLLGLFAAFGSAADTHQAARTAISEAFPGMAENNIKPSPIEGLYEVRNGAQVFYVSSDGRYLVQGDIYDVASEDNLTELSRTVARLDAVEDIGESTMLIFAPDDVKHTVTVFTDIDCGYCRKLHRQIDEYNALGIKVRYMFFPRSGPDTESWYKADNVWCAEDRNAALTRAKAGAVIDSEDCGTTPVAAHYELGLRFGIRGTPAILTDSGELIGGYLPPDELSEYLE